MFRLTWLGQGGFLLECGSGTLAIDPYLSDLVEISDGLKRLVPAAFPMESFAPDFIFLTHEHIDHLDSIYVDRMPKGKTVFLCPEACRKILLAHGVSDERIRVLKENDEITAAGFALRAVYAEHTEGSLGAVVGKDGLSVYFTGDTVWSERLAEGVKADVINTCINGRWGNMNHEEAALVAKKVGARLAIPNHYGMFRENTADPEDFRRALEGSGIAYYEMTWNRPFDLREIYGSLVSAG
ncbi:MAG: MBL fold metallo-hydrolase [Clostridia bacterium]|nr:MBL fold metallo-hydrolase [Clostridia bacterium]